MPAITSSELTKLNQEKTIYADIFTQQQLYAQGLIPSIRYSNTSRRDNQVILTGFVGGGVQLNSTAVLKKSYRGDYKHHKKVVYCLRGSNPRRSAIRISKRPTLYQLS